MNHQKDLTIIRIEDVPILREINPLNKPTVGFYDFNDPEEELRFERALREWHQAESKLKEYKLRVQQEQEDIAADQILKKHTDNFFAANKMLRFDDVPNSVFHAAMEEYATLKAKGNQRVWQEVDVKERLPEKEGWFFIELKTLQKLCAWYVPDFKCFDDDKENRYADYEVSHWLEPIGFSVGQILKCETDEATMTARELKANQVTL